MNSKTKKFEGFMTLEEKYNTARHELFRSFLIDGYTVVFNTWKNDNYATAISVHSWGYSRYQPDIFADLTNDVGEFAPSVRIGTTSYGNLTLGEMLDNTQEMMKAMVVAKNISDIFMHENIGQELWDDYFSRHGCESD